MIIIKDNELNSKDIMNLRKLLMKDNRKTRKLINVCSGTIVNELPIRNREFDLWIFKNNEKTIGFTTFKNTSDKIILRALYVFPEYRKCGNGEKILNELVNNFKNVEYVLDENNIPMLNLSKKLNFIKKDSINMIWGNK